MNWSLEAWLGDGHLAAAFLYGECVAVVALARWVHHGKRRTDA